MKTLGLAIGAFLLIAASPATETEHVVKNGETLGGIANRAGVSAGAIATANGLKEPFSVRIGQRLKIPRDRQAAKAPTAFSVSYVVKEGETLGGIANRSGVSASAIAKANGLKEPYAVRVGQKLAIPGGRALEKPKPAPTSSGAYVVKEGETLGGIANRTGVSASAIAKANGLKEPYSVRIGQKLVIPGKSSPQHTESSADDRIPVGATEYVVKEGETLGGIANRAGVARIVIAEANGLREPYEVQAGQKLIIPRQRTHVVKAGETGFDIAYQYGIPFGRIAVANGLASDATLKVGQKLLIPAITRAPETSSASPPPAPRAPEPAPARFRWPLTGAIAEGFNSGEGGQGHNGIDIAAAEGEPVKAAASGIVIYAQMERSRFGNLVIIDHGDRWHTAYGHMSRIAAKKGASVRAGEVIGYAGSTGTATTPELHFEVRNRNKPVEPQSVLGPQG
jgi:murein DD-endopeptidase MepM/ murein hydrolase activator NlpD